MTALWILIYTYWKHKSTCEVLFYSNWGNVHFFQCSHQVWSRPNPEQDDWQGSCRSSTTSRKMSPTCLQGWGCQLLTTSSGSSQVQQQMLLTNLTRLWFSVALQRHKYLHGHLLRFSFIWIKIHAPISWEGVKNMSDSMATCDVLWICLWLKSNSRKGFSPMFLAD